MTTELGRTMVLRGNATGAIGHGVEKKLKTEVSRMLKTSGSKAAADESTGGVASGLR